MRLYGVVVNISGMEPMIKLVEEDVYLWIDKPVNTKAKIDPVPFSVFEKMANENKYMRYFTNDTNDLVIPRDYENTKAEIAPAFKDGFEDVDSAKAYCAENGFEYAGTVIKYLQS